MKKILTAGIKSCLLLLVCGPTAAVVVQISDFDKDGAPDYTVSSKYYTATLINPGAKSLAAAAPGVFRGGWFKTIVLAENGKGFLAGNHDVNFGFTQAFDQLRFLPAGQSADAEPAPEDQKKAAAELAAAVFQPWQSNVEKNETGGEAVISFSQEVQIAPGKSYKLRTDVKFGDSAKIVVKGILFNNSKELLTATVYPRPFFNFNAESDSPAWVVIPSKKALNIGGRKTAAIGAVPEPVPEMPQYTEYHEDRLSKVERWVAVGGIGDDEVFAILARTPLTKVIFWKENDSFGVGPAIKIEALPEQRAEWEWALLFGKGLHGVSKVTDSGIYAVKNTDGKDGLEVLVSLLPPTEMNGIALDFTLNSPEGKMIMNKNKEFAGLSPLLPGTIRQNLPPEMKNKRYLLKLEFLANDNPVEQFSHWLNPPDAVPPRSAKPLP